jgi:hypothetical protein
LFVDDMDDALMLAKQAERSVLLLKRHRNLTERTPRSPRQSQSRTPHGPSPITDGLRDTVELVIVGSCTKNESRRGKTIDNTRTSAPQLLGAHRTVFALTCLATSGELDRDACR